MMPGNDAWNLALIAASLPSPSLIDLAESAGFLVHPGPDPMRDPRVRVHIPTSDPGKGKNIEVSDWWRSCSPAFRAEVEARARVVKARAILGAASE